MSSEDRVPDVSPEVPPIHWRAALRMMRFLPQGALSRGFGNIADTPLPRALRRPVLSSFASMMGIAVEDAEKKLEDYASINEFFVRRLRPGLRPIDASHDHAVSPVDGVVGETGNINGGQLLQAKGRSYSAAGILADTDHATRFDRGTFATIYLSPRHYHRIHAPAGGGIIRADHIPGALFPVNAAGVSHVEDLFPRNERLICTIDSAHGAIAVVAVGAYNVGRISAAFDSAWRNGETITNRRGARAETRRYSPPRGIDKGAEIMAFHLGSTVVLLFERKLAFARGVTPGAEILMGATLGSFE